MSGPGSPIPGFVRRRRRNTFRQKEGTIEGAFAREQAELGGKPGRSCDASVRVSSPSVKVLLSKPIANEPWRGHRSPCPPPPHRSRTPYLESRLPGFPAAGTINAVLRWSTGGKSVCGNPKVRRPLKLLRFGRGFTLGPRAEKRINRIKRGRARGKLEAKRCLRAANPLCIRNVSTGPNDHPGQMKPDRNSSAGGNKHA